MELGELCKKTLEIFECKDVSDLGGKLYDAVMNSDIMKLTVFCDTVEDLTVDWLQKIFQYYEADRQEKKQDYTPKTIAKLCAELTETGGSTVYDICAGSGALTIQKWVRNPDKLFICEELDEKVIPYLLFNMAVRNMSGYVINRNVLTMKCNKVYRLHCGEAFSIAEEIKEVPEIIADEIVSNPPYNIKWDAPKPMFADNRFQEVIPPASNANFAFVLTALSRLKNGGKCAFVLPNGVLQSDIERQVRQVLTDSGRIEKVILMPDKMFECTTIGTNVCVFGNGNRYIDFYDCRKKADQEQREQNGQFGGKSHTNRTYYKTINVLSDELINKLCGECEDIAEFSFRATTTSVKNMDYLLTPSRYIRFEERETKHRPFKEIADNINYITRMQNACKLVINETIAKSIGLDVDLYRQSKQQSIDTVKTMKGLGFELEAEDYISFTKNKNEFVFKCNDKELMPDIFIQFFGVWKNQIALLNTMQNQYLEELRNALLPDLMSGKLDVTNVNS
ncbi:MAG: N-6 DNA methylase [Clostridia bacterium]|nr:N-6 DNA methylase [Clostridia bacterium]